MNLAAQESHCARMLQMIRAAFGGPVMSVQVGCGSNAIAFAGAALGDVDRLRAVAARARQLQDELGLGFHRLPALVLEYLQLSAGGAVPARHDEAG
jgi:hypothetical protein